MLNFKFYLIDYGYITMEQRDWVNKNKEKLQPWIKSIGWTLTTLNDYKIELSEQERYKGIGVCKIEEKLQWKKLK